ncbi:MAG: cation transporter [Planctomycetaceae bacterium]|nr:cation transporter [Planctomycetaceae bacterium]
MPHDHDHDHSHDAANGSSSRRRLTIALLLTAGYLVAEVVGGLLTNSLALLADAGHMLTDVASLALALFAVWLAARPAPPEKTFGYYRAEILAALVNGAALLAACGWIIFEAIRRFREPAEVLGPGMFGVACGGLVVNLIAMKVLHGSHEHNLNVRGAWLHVIADTLGSVAAIVGAILVWWKNWYWADPAASVAIAFLVLFSAWRLTAQATSVLMESVPEGLDIEAIRGAIANTPGVANQHDLHVWSITTGRVCLSVHVTSEPNLPRGEMLRRLRPMLLDKFGISHTTIQVEPQDYDDCGSNCD